jgi:hypothetical protein
MEYMSFKFADSIEGKICSFSVKALCSLEDVEDIESVIKAEMAKDTRLAAKMQWQGIYIFPVSAKRKIILGGDGISVTTQYENPLPTYRYEAVAINDQQSLMMIWYDDAPPIYASIYDVIQEKTRALKFIENSAAIEQLEY